jgi:hypothetical protein
MRSQRPRRLVAVLASLASVGALGIFGAPGAVAASSEPTGQGTGPQPTGLGLGSKAALAQDNCAENGRTSLALHGTGPRCVNPWPAGKNNGGATAPGVTKDSVKAIIYIENEQQTTGGTGSQAPVDQTTGKTGSLRDAVRDAQKAYDYAQENLHTYQTWGRTIDFEVFEASGADETAQRADATAIAAKQPFIVFDQTRWATGGAPALATALAAKHILTVSGSTTPKIGKAQDPYRWANSTDSTAGIPLTAAFVGRSLAGEKAHWAGDSDLAAKKRVFAVVYPNSADFDYASFQPLLTKSGGPKIAADFGFDPNDNQQAAEQASTSIVKFKQAGVTSVVLFAPGPLVSAIMTAANAQDYHPEWVFTGFGYQDYDGFGRTFPQDQMKQAFGLSILWPYADPKGINSDAFRWYWGRQQGVYSSTIPSIFSWIYTAVHYAGPTLTAENVKKGLFSVPSIVTLYGRNGYGNTVGMPYPEYAGSGTDLALAYWDGETTAPTQAGVPLGKGVFRYLDGGKRYNFETMPKTEPKFFDPNGAVNEVPYSALFPDGVVPPSSPCTGCPSSGATSTGSS